MQTWTMTSPAIRDAMRSNRTQGIANVAVVPTGSIEQHGPRLPLDTDTRIAKALASELDRLENGNLFLYPELAYTNADAGMDYPGTISVPQDALRATVRGVCRSIRSQGFDALCFVDGHGINAPALAEEGFRAVRESFAEDAPFPVIVLAAYGYHGPIRDRFGVEPGKHADWFEELLFIQAGGVPSDSPHHAMPQPSLSVPGVAGIPMPLRSCEGVIGQTAPPSDLATGIPEAIWQFIVESSHRDLVEALTNFPFPEA